ncbi:VCBS repeat-containing protein [Fulvivirgaceae bacterium BMA12]|uniref:VCBS repeat-containing protein n=1 Tax=Agaribacillus aureus TaxID=3051825 RepID=A0ABT8LLE0_9BACT|nr:VCBS repeat-containing protein [Fulvivirgaceae bacterium BMA12]
MALKKIGKAAFGVLLLFLISCGEEGDGPDNLISITDHGAKPLYTIVGHEESGIDFRNDIQENNNLNGIFYEYLYNGGGVALGDLNNDGFTDIYFISNLRENKLYLNKGNLKFEDVSAIARVGGKGGLPTGVTLVDINADGWLDIYVCKSGKYNNLDLSRNELYVNQGNNARGVPVFKEMAKAYGLDLPHFSTQAAFFDYDKDGDLDLFLINHGLKNYYDNDLQELYARPAPLQSERLFRNDHNRFIDVSGEAGITNNAISFGLGLAIGDLNNDFWPDILVGQDFAEKDHLYLNQKDGTFKEVMTKSTNHISYFSMGNDIADFNNDGWLDFASVDMVSEHNYDVKTSMSGMNPKRFYQLVDMGLHHQYMFNTLQVNNGNLPASEGVPVFSDIAQMSGVSNTDWSWGPLFLDMDNDGWKDLFIANGVKRDFRNNDYLRYKQARFDDFFSKHPDNTPENKQLARELVLTLVNEMPTRKRNNYFFHNLNGQEFSKRNDQWVDSYLTNSNGAAYADLDNDGDLDIVVNNMDDFAMIYQNNARELGMGNFLQVKLTGSGGNSRGVGARVMLEHNGQRQLQENYYSRGFQSASAGPLHYGVGQSKTIESVKIVWPDGNRVEYKDVKVNQVLQVNHETAVEKYHQEQVSKTLFVDVTQEASITYRHQENEYDDFAHESLLPHRMSQFGPAMDIYDLNEDGLDDVFIGGAHGQAGRIFRQQANGAFREYAIHSFENDRNHEDVDALFFDADGDNDADLYVVSGGNEFEEGNILLQDRLYENTGNGQFTKLSNMPFANTSGSCVKAADYDRDGDLDLFIGGRQKPGHYPMPATSHLLRNDSKNGAIIFTDVTKKAAGVLIDVGMVTDAVWLDLDRDSWLDLVLVGEWMAPTVLRNNQGSFEDITSLTGLSDEKGWWFTIATADFDNDGDKDLIAGNLGLNYKYKATKSEPFEVFQKDFDGNGSLDIVLGYYDAGKRYPLRGRECTSNQMPFIKEKFKSYHEFGLATLSDVYGDGNLQSSLHLQAKNFASCYFENKGDGFFDVKPLPAMAQLSAVNAINIDDFDKDGHLDLVISGNFYPVEVETVRNDASYGLFLKGNGKGEFKPVLPFESGFYAKGDVRHSKIIKRSYGKKGILIAKNNDFLQLLEINQIMR